MKRFFTLSMIALFAIAGFAAPQEATMDTTELIFRHFYEGHPFYHPDWKSWTITLQNDNYQFDFEIYGGTPTDPTGTYTEEDLDSYTSKAFIPVANGKTSYYKTCNLTIKKEYIGASLIKYVLDAELVTTLGRETGATVNGIFKLHAEQESIVPVAYYDEAIYHCVITPNEAGFTLEGKNDTMDVDLSFLTNQGIVGFYTHKSLDVDNTQLVRLGTPYEIISMDGGIVSSPNIYNSITYVAMMEIVAGSEEDTIFINLAMEAPVVPTDTIDINCYNLILDASAGTPEQRLIIATAHNDDYDIYLGYNDILIRDSAAYDGINAMAYITEIATESTINALTTSIIVKGNKQDGYLLTGQIIGNNHKLYNLNLTNILPEKKDTIDINFTTNSKAMFDIDELGLYELQLANYNEEYSVAFDILNINRILLTEEFEITDLYIDKAEMATYLTKHTEDGEVNVEMIKVDGTIVQKNDTTFLTATITGMDLVLYNVSMFYTVPTPTDTISYTFNQNNTLFTNALPQGIFILEGMTDDGQAMCNIQVNRITTGSPEGTFICDGKFEENQFEPFETYVSILKDPAKQEYETHYMQKGEMTVTIDKENLLVVATASFICDDAILYQLSLTAPYEIPHLPEDAEDEGANYTFGRNTEVFVMDDYLESNGYIEYILYVENPFNMLDLIFFIDETDPDIIIPEGVYPFGAYGSKNHVLASRGMAQDSQTGEIYPLPSYYQTLDELSQPYGYFLVAGQVTVEKVDGHIVLNVDAINSNYLPVKILYDPSITAVENVENTPSNSIHKQLINGQLLIIHNNEVYTATGVRVK